jgi:hypothetical protein
MAQYLSSYLPASVLNFLRAQVRLPLLRLAPVAGRLCSSPPPVCSNNNGGCIYLMPHGEAPARCTATRAWSGRCPTAHRAGAAFTPYPRAVVRRHTARRCCVKLVPAYRAPLCLLFFSRTARAHASAAASALLCGEECCAPFFAFAAATLPPVNCAPHGRANNRVLKVVAQSHKRRRRALRIVYHGRGIGSSSSAVKAE